MSALPPRPKNAAVQIPYIDPADPLPSQPEPEGRWYEPYRTLNGHWRVNLRVRLTQRQILMGCMDTLLEETEEEIRRKMELQDALAEQTGEA